MHNKTITFTVDDIKNILIGAHAEIHNINQINTGTEIITTLTFSLPEPLTIDKLDLSMGDNLLSKLSLINGQKDFIGDLCQITVLN